MLVESNERCTADKGRSTTIAETSPTATSECECTRPKLLNDGHGDLQAKAIAYNGIMTCETVLSEGTVELKQHCKQLQRITSVRRHRRRCRRFEPRVVHRCANTGTASHFCWFWHPRARRCVLCDDVCKQLRGRGAAVLVLGLHRMGIGTQWHLVCPYLLPSYLWSLPNPRMPVPIICVFYLFSEDYDVRIVPYCARVCLLLALALEDVGMCAVHAPLYVVIARLR